MTEKVKLTHKQVDAIEYFKNKWGDQRIIMLHAEMLLDAEHEPIDQEVNLAGMPLLTLVDALRIGYEVEPEYKVGDWVVRLSNECDTREAFAEGRMFQIKRLAGALFEDEFGFLHKSSVIRHATPEEIKAEKERRVWAGIGREVLEFREGDWLEKYDGSIWFITLNLTALPDCKISRVDAKRWYADGLVKGIIPAESFVSFEEGEEPGVCDTCGGSGEVFQESGAGIHATANIGYVTCPDCEDCHTEKVGDSNA